MYLRLTLGALIFLCSTAKSQSPISGITTASTSATSALYTATSPNDAAIGINSNTSYQINNGAGSNVRVTAYSIGGSSYTNFLQPDTLIIKRTDGGSFLNVWYTLDQINVGTSPNTLVLEPDRANDLETLYQSGNINAGFDDLLINTDDVDSYAPSQVERVDVLWYSGLVTCAPANAVFSIIERGGDDDIRVAAITSLDANGDPNAYSSTVLIEANDWPQTGVTFNSVLTLRRTATGQDPLPLINRGTSAGQSSLVIQGMAVSFQDLGVSTGQVIYGYSIFAADTDENNVSIDLADITTFPTNTVASDSGLDLVAGLSAAVSDGNCLVEAVGPGGYQASLTTWLKADDGALTTSGGTVPGDGASMSFWEDQAVGGYDFENLGIAPLYRSTSSTINFNPGIDFVENSERDLTITRNEDYNFKAFDSGFEKKVIHLVFRTNANDIQTRQQLFDHGGDLTGMSAYIENGNLYTSAWEKINNGSAGAPWNNGTNTTFISTSLVANTEYVFTLEFEGNIGITGTLKGYLNGDQFGTLSSVGLLFNEKDDIVIGDASSTSRYHDGTTLASSFEGELSEFIYVNEPASITLTQRQKTESYLALKYGISLDQSIPVNYFNENGDVVFDATNSTALGGFLTYNNDIAGIGRDDDSELLQSASKSENSGSILKVTKNSGLSSNNSWLIWGHEGSANALQNTDVPLTVQDRLKRSWRFDETNETGTLDLTFDLTGLGLSTDPDDFRLLVASSGSNGSFASSTPVSGAAMNGFLLTFSGVNLNDGEFVALGAAASTIGPGGVATNLAFWIKANDGTNTTTNGAEVTSWSDQLGAFSATGTSGSAPVYLESGANYNPGVEFNGVDELMSATGGLNTVAYFLVIRPDNTFSTSTSAQTPLGFEVGSTAASNNVGGLFFGDQFSAPTLITHLVGTGSTLYARGLSGTSRTIDAGKPYILGVRTNAAANETEISLNGELIDNGGFSTLLEAVNEAYTLGRFGVNNQGFTGWFDGEVMEVFSYSTRPSDTEIQQIESYLALKYGITLDQSTAQDYLSAAGNVIWDASSASGYTTDIAGIMQDDNSDLLQKQSRSQNDEAILTVGVGTLVATNAANSGTFPQNSAFWIWGHDTNDVTKASVISSDIPPLVTERTKRVWRITTSEPSHDLSFSFDLTGLGYTLTAEDFSLIVSTTSTMANGVSYTGGVINGNQITFSNVNVPVGDSFFSLGTGRKVCGPGGVDADLELWLRADAGTNAITDGANVTDWADQSTENRDAVAVDLGGGTPVAPTYEVDEMNFNPGIRLYDANSVNSSYLKTTNGNDVADQFMMFVVYKSIQTDGTANSMTNSPALVGTDVSGDLDYGVGIQNGQPFINADNNNTFSVQSGTQYNTNQPLIVSAFRTFNGFGNFGAININSEAPSGATVSTTSLSSPTDFGIGNHSSPTVAAQFEGVIGDVIVYSSVKGFDDRNKIESHLALKYGITRQAVDDVNSTIDDRDYIISNGTSVWDYDGQGSTYHNDIAGIGIDNEGCLLQVKSKSNNADARVTMYVGSFSNNNSFLVWGNDNAALEDDTNRDYDDSQVKSRLNREWRVQETGVLNTVTLEFDLAGVTGPTGVNTNDLSQVVLMVDADGDFTSGASIFSPASTSTNTVTFTVDFNSGNYFTIGSSQIAALPIGLVSFEAEAKKEQEVVLTWETSNEYDNAYFTVERSENGTHFAEIAYLDGAGTSSATQRYVYHDLAVGKGVYYYRLKQTDFNGSSTLSEVVRAEVQASEFQVDFYPNPVRVGEVFTMRVRGADRLDKAVEIRAMNGQVVYTNPVMDNNQGTIQINTSHLLPGIYLIRVVIGKQLVTHKLIVE